MSLGQAVYNLRKSTGADRFDVPLPYGNKLVFLRHGTRLYVRLLLIVDGLKTFVTPKLAISPQELRCLLTQTYAETNLGAVNLSSDQRELIVSFGVRRIPVPNSVWKPVARLAVS